jgi:hypothetical protein
MVNPNLDFSLVLGGPLYRLFLRTRLARPPLQCLYRRMAAISLVAWLPLVPLTIWSSNAWRGVNLPFLFDLDAHARFLIALPLLIAAELVVHERMRPIIQQFLDRGVIPLEERPRFQAIVESTLRLRNSVWIELFILLVVLTVGHWTWKNYSSLKIATWYATTVAGRVEYTPAGYWYVFVSIPIFQFILFRWYFRFALWYRFLWKTSRLKLQLTAIHPDRAGGIGFLGYSAYAITPVLLAHTVVLAGLIGNHIWHEAGRLTDYKLEILGFVLFLLLVVLVPLSFFTFQLQRTKRLGSIAFGGFATRYVNEFSRKWIQGGAPEGESPLGSGDIQSLADLANSNDVVQQMHLIPFDKQTLIRTTIILLLPFVPLTLTMMPLEKMIDKFLGILI